MDYFVEYQPEPFGQAWGNDPEYAEMATTLKSFLDENNDISGIHIAKALNVFGSKRCHSKKKTKQKKERNQSKMTRK